MIIMANSKNGVKPIFQNVRYRCQANRAPAGTTRQKKPAAPTSPLLTARKAVPLRERLGQRAFVVALPFSLAMNGVVGIMASQ